MAVGVWVGVSVGVFVGVDVGVGVKVAVGVDVNVAVEVGVDVNVAVEVGVEVEDGGGVPSRVIWGANQRALSWLGDPFAVTNIINLTLFPARGLKSISTGKYLPSYTSFQ